MHRAGLIVLLVAGCGVPTAAGEPDLMPCVYAARATLDHPQPEPAPHSRCARLDENGALHLVPAHVEAMNFGEDGLAEVEVAGAWYYVKPTGDALRVVTFDNGPDPFAEGLVRGLREGKVAYFDARFTMVVPPRYDWGWPFERGFALVCTDCGPGPPEGEHTPIVGGSWGWIDRAGREVVPLVHSRADALTQRPAAAATE